MSNKERGVYGKYILSKADGGHVDPEACYFVLRLDTDKAARVAARVYARECDNERLRVGVDRCCDWLDAPPACTCGGGRDRDIVCPFHDGGIFDHPVWRHGGDVETPVPSLCHDCLTPLDRCPLHQVTLAHDAVVTQCGEFDGAKGGGE